MKKMIKRAGIIGMLMMGLGMLTPLQATEGKKEDPRIRVENNRVKIWLLNGQKGEISVKVYDRQRRIIGQMDLGDNLTVGKILDFKGSERDYYGITVFRNEKVLFMDSFQLGTE